MNINTFNFYAFLSIVLLSIDRLTKHFVMYTMPHYQIHPLLSVDLVFNRGISFGFFHSDNGVVFTGINILIGCVIILLAAHTYSRVVNNKIIIGEVFIFTGAVSNIVDRFIYGGVVDFIALSYRDWHFAVFNIADGFIFFGVMLMLILEYTES